MKAAAASTEAQWEKMRPWLAGPLGGDAADARGSRRKDGEVNSPLQTSGGEEEKMAR